MSKVFLDDGYPEEGLYKLIEDIKANWTQPTGVKVEDNIGWDTNPDSVEAQVVAMDRDRNNYTKDGKMYSMKPEVLEEKNRLNQIWQGDTSLVSSETISLQSEDLHVKDGIHDNDSRNYFQTQTRSIEPYGTEPGGTWHSTTRSTDVDAGYVTDHNEVFQKLVPAQVSPGVAGDLENPEHYIPQQNTIRVTAPRLQDEELLAGMPSYAVPGIPDTEVRAVGGEDARVNLYEAKLIDDFGSVGQTMVKNIGSGDIGPDGKRRYQVASGDFEFNTAGTFGAMAKLEALKRKEREDQTKEDKLERSKRIQALGTTASIAYKGQQAWDTHSKIRADEIIDKETYGPDGESRYELKDSKFLDTRKAEDRIQETKEYKSWKKDKELKTAYEDRGVKSDRFKVEEVDGEIPSDIIEENVIYDVDGNVTDTLAADTTTFAENPVYTSPTEGPGSFLPKGKSEHIKSIEEKLFAGEEIGPSIDEGLIGPVEDGEPFVRGDFYGESNKTPQATSLQDPNMVISSLPGTGVDGIGSPTKNQPTYVKNPAEMARMKSSQFYEGGGKLWEDGELITDESLNTQKIIELESGSTSGFYSGDSKISDLDAVVQNSNITTSGADEILNEVEVPTVTPESAGNLVGDLGKGLAKDAITGVGLELGKDLISDVTGIEDETLDTAHNVYKGAKTVKSAFETVKTAKAAKDVGTAAAGSGGAAGGALVPGLSIAAGAFQMLTADEPEDKIAGGVTALGGALMFTPLAPLGAVMVAGSSLWSIFS